MTMIRCSVHGVSYDDEVHADCGLCRRGEVEDQKRKRSRNIIFISAAIFSLIVSYLLVYPIFDLLVASSNRQITTNREDFVPNLQFDPESYRSSIESIERILYKKTPSSFMDSEQLEAALDQLAEALQARGKNLMLNTAINQINTFAINVGSSTDAGFANLDLAWARQRWEYMRSKLFKSAEWFEKTSPGLVDAQNPSASKEISPEQLSDLGQTLEYLELLIESAASESGIFGEIAVDVSEDSAEARILVQQWNAWSQDWDQRLRASAASLPSQPSIQDNQNAYLAFQSIQTAYHELSLLPSAANDYGVPFRSEREHRIQNAWQALKQARQSLGMPPLEAAPPALAESGAGNQMENTFDTTESSAEEQSEDNIDDPDTWPN